MRPVDEAKLPPPHQAARRVHRGDGRLGRGGGRRRRRRRWPAAVSATEVFELFARYGCRDFRDIGHKAIFVANSYRTLQTIGWRHAEPVLRSLAYALLEHEGDNPAKRDGDADRPGRRERASWRRRSARLAARPQADAGGEPPTCWPRCAPRSADELSDKVVRHAERRRRPGVVWDGLFLGAGELLMRQPGIVGLHTLTTLNALHFAYQTSGDDETRRLLLLQAAAFLPLFREAMLAPRQGRPTPAIDALETADEQADDRRRAIFADAVEGQAAAAAQDAGAAAGGPGERAAADGAGPAAGLREGHRLARLQVQLGGAGGLLPRRPGVARPLPGGEPVLAEGLGRPRRAAGGADAARRWPDAACGFAPRREAASGGAVTPP